MSRPTLHLPPARPEGVCLNCYRTWRAITPPQRLVWCWHSQTAARLKADGSWKTISGVDQAAFKQLRNQIEGGDLPPAA